MTTLDQYLAANSSVTLTKLSAALKVSKGRLSQLRHLTEWPPELALDIERETQGALDASILSSVVARSREERAA